MESLLCQMSTSLDGSGPPLTPPLSVKQRWTCSCLHKTGFTPPLFFLFLFYLPQRNLREVLSQRRPGRGTTSCSIPQCSASSRSLEPERGIYCRPEPVCYPPSQIQLYFVLHNIDVKNLVDFDYIYGITVDSIIQYIE